MNERETRVLQVITGSDYGGAQQHLLWLCKGLQEQGFAVSVACQPEGYLVDRLERVGVTVLPLPHMARRIDPLNDWRTSAELYRLVKDLRPDLVHAHSSKAGALARLAAATRGVPAVFTAHGLVFSNTVMPSWKRWVYSRVERTLGRLTAHLIAVSAADGDLALRHRLVPAERLSVIRNGVPVPSAEELAQLRGAGRERLGLSPGTHLIGVIARLHPDKDLTTWLRAAALVHKRLPAVEFVVIGDGPEAAALRGLARDLGLDGAVRWSGEQPDAARLLPALDLFVLSSVKEGLPLTVLEAMAAGLPVVAAAVGGVPEAVADGRTGLLVPARDPETLAQAVVRVLGDPAAASAMGASGRQRVREQFSLDRVVSQTVSVYERVLREGGSGR